jgi:membrane protein DedA with SNARE-associated domain
VTLESIIETYGYWALLVGTFFEGETVLVLGGFAAHRGYLTLPWVILAAFIGSLCAVTSSSFTSAEGTVHSSWHDFPNGR